MPTLGDMKAAIADDIDDTTGEYAVQIERAILTAIRYCARKSYYFNETRGVTFDTVADQAIYGVADVPALGAIVRITGVYLTRPGGDVVDLWPSPVGDLEVLGDSFTAPNEPVTWSYFDRALRFYPVPDKAYSVRLQLGPYRLDALDDDDSSNVWTEDAYDMIKARAKYILGKDTLKDPNLAAEALNDFNDQHAALSGETADRTGTGFVRPTCF